MRFGLKIATVLLGFVATALSGCAAVGSVQPNPLDGTSWLLVSLEERAPIAGTEIAVVFEAGSVQGSSGCNHFGASYRISGDRIEIREIESTLMGCIEPEGAMEQEQAFV